MADKANGYATFDPNGGKAIAFKEGYIEGARKGYSEATKWVDVKERLPEENISVLWCKYPVEEPYLVASMCDDEFDEYPNNYFTHWMPLPQPPKD